jgi:hypothetical protein
MDTKALGKLLGHESLNYILDFDMQQLIITSRRDLSTVHRIFTVCCLVVLFGGLFTAKAEAACTLQYDQRVIGSGATEIDFAPWEDGKGGFDPTYGPYGIEGLEDCQRACDGVNADHCFAELNLNYFGGGSGNGIVRCYSYANATGLSAQPSNPATWSGITPWYSEGPGNYSRTMACFTPSPNTPPNPPTISGPTTGDTDASYTFTLTATDPDGDNIFYQIDWDNNGTVDQRRPGVGDIASGASNSVLRDWSSAGTYTFRARTRDVNGGTSAWTTHMIDISAPPAPAINIAPLSINFGDVLVGNAVTRELTITNTGGGTLTIDANPSITGAFAGSYQCLSSNCAAEQNLTAGDDVTYTVRYAPTSVSNGQSATLNLTGTFDRSVSLTGNGVSAPPPLPTANFTAPASPHNINVGDTVTLEWNSTDAISCTIEAWEGVTRVAVFSGLSQNGSRVVSPTADTRYNLYCSNSSGDSPDSPDVVVTVSAPPPGVPTADLFIRVNGGSWQSSLGSAINAGDAIDLQWTSSDATTCSATAGAGFATGGAISDEVTVTTPPAGGTDTFAIECTGPGGTAADSISVSVSATPPPPPPVPAPVTDIAVSINGGTYVSGDQTISEGDTVSIRWDGRPDADTCTGTNVNTGGAVNGQTSVTAPAPGTATTYTVTCENTSGSDAASITVTKSQLTDLTVAIVDYTTSPGWSLATGNYDTVSVTLLIRNSGAATTDPVTVEVAIDKTSGSGAGPFTDTVTRNIGPMSDGAERTEVVTFSDVPFATAFVRAEVDPADLIPETNNSVADNTALEMVAELPPPVDMLLTIDPEDLVRGGENVTLDWDTVAYFPMDCTMTGPTLSIPPWNPSLTAPPTTGTATAGPINAKSEFTLQCTEPLTSTVYTERVSVETTGQVEEI